MSGAESAQPPKCGARTVFWPDDEACDAECWLPPHEGTVHEDEALGQWDEDDLFTVHP